MKTTKPELSIRFNSDAIEVRVRCKCGYHMGIFNHNSKDKLHFFCHHCEEESELILKPPCKCRKS